MKITTTDRVMIQDRSEMKCEKCKKETFDAIVFDAIIANPPYSASDKLKLDEEKEHDRKVGWIHVDVPRSKGGGKRTHPKKSSWNKSKPHDKLGNVILICGGCKSDLQIERVSVRLPSEEVRRIESWMETMLPNENLSGVLRLAVKKLIDETSDVAMELQMAKMKILTMEKKIQMMNRIFNLPEDDVKRLDMLMIDGEGEMMAVEVKTHTKKKRETRLRSIDFAGGGGGIAERRRRKQ